MLVVPGGSYWFLSYDNEGVSQADWLNAQGVTAFILMYRLPGEGWPQRENVPLQDAQRAMRLIRSRAQQFGIMPERVGVLGFSAGGHLAGSLATCHAEPVYAPVDAADGLSARPDVAGLIYPVISVDALFTHEGSRAALLGQNPTEASRKARSVELRVTDDTSPVFLMHAADDGAVPVANSIALFQAMQAKARPVALHVFEHGGHGFGVRLPASEPASIWPTLFAAFAAGTAFSRHSSIDPSPCQTGNNRFERKVRVGQPVADCPQTQGIHGGCGIGRRDGSCGGSRGGQCQDRPASRPADASLTNGPALPPGTR